MRFLITGGAGFIGANLASSLIARKESVTLFDNLSRPGCSHNLAWLRASYDDVFKLLKGDVRDTSALTMAVRDADVVVHLAGQVAVTTSVANPREDFEINALGTLNVLEAIRLSPSPPILIYASTNKVYGQLVDVGISEEDTRYRFRDVGGITETRELDLHSPYGCSKGSADQYVRDYARTYGLRTVVFRQSCIYGPRQFGVEDQGWVAHFAIAALTDRPITIFGDGKQVRDLLHVSDLVDAYLLAIENIGVATGQIYNLGGGLANSLSIWSEFGPILETLAGRNIPVTFREARVGDQLVCVMDTTKARSELGWDCRVSLQEGIERLWNWVSDNRPLFEAPR